MHDVAKGLSHECVKVMYLTPSSYMRRIVGIEAPTWCKLGYLVISSMWEYPSAPSIDAIFPLEKASRTSLGVTAYPSCSQHTKGGEHTSSEYNSINRLATSICSSVSRTPAFSLIPVKMRKYSRLEITSVARARLARRP